MFKKKRKPQKYITWERSSPTYRKRRKQKRWFQFGNTLKKNTIKKNQPSSFKLKPILISILTLGIISFIIFSPTFKISNIKFENYNFETQALNLEIENLLSETKNQHIIPFKKHHYEEMIKNKISSIEQISINKKLPNSIIISYKEYPLIANILSESPQGKKGYIINSTGHAIKENLEQPDLPKIIMITSEPPNTDIPLINQEQITYIIDAVKNFEDKFGLKVIETRYLKTARELHLITEKDFTIWLDIQQPHETQYRKLKKAIIKLDIHNTPLQYIDLRIAGENGDKIIYKRK